jgi:mannitol 2-dehydrogenase
MAKPEVRRFLDELLYHEAVPSLTQIPGHPAEDYAATVLERFANTGVRDQIARLCIDGAAKFPVFLLPTISYQLEHDGPIARGALALAGWARYLAETPVDQQAFDASGDIARDHARNLADNPARFLDIVEVFPPDLRDNARFATAFTDAWRRVGEVGPLAAMGE